MHVLIADDDPGTRLTASAAVERLGHRCTLTEDGEAAWRAYQAETPDVVITDGQMPGMDGTTLVQAIRAQSNGRYAYVIVLTGVADEESARATMQAGADDLLVKPLEPAQLERTLIVAERVTAMHRRMHEDVRHDAATGLANRLRLAEDLEALRGRVARYGHVYCVAVFDVDNFQGINDSAGHLFGDQTLRTIAQTLQREVRSGDAVYRYGGEEFLVLLPEQSLESATLAAERLRAAVEQLAIPHPGGGVVTVSAGVAGLRDPQCGPEEICALADQALYRAKEGGRNRVEVHQANGAPSTNRIRLLVADDDPMIRLTLSALIERESGFELVGTAEDADEAVEMAARRRPDVVLLDFNMPGGGGVRAAMQIRDAIPNVKLVAVSADDSAAAQYEMSRAGAVGYVVKGSPDEEIVRVIRSSVRW
jgi:diguanylate cyclase (GGDEF)-like protein